MLISFILFVSFLVIYAFGVSPTSFGGDSGDIILSYFFGGVSHPPGYPLNTMLGYLLTHGPLALFNLDFVYRANFVSAIYHAFTLGFLYILVKRLTKNAVVALFSVTVLGFSVLFWLYAHTAEVFQLTSVLIVASLLFLFKWWEEVKTKRHKTRYLYLAFFLLGLAAFHHQTVLLVLPAYVYSLYQVLRKKQSINLFKIGAAFLLGVLPYIYAIWQGFTNNIYNWATPTNFDDFMRLITRADYGTFSATKELVGLTFGQRFLQLEWYVRVFIADFSVLGVVFFILGALYLFIKKRDYFWFFSLAWVFSGPFFLFYSSFPILSSFTKGVIERFVLASYLFAIVFIGFGFAALLMVLKRLLYKKAIKNEKVFGVIAFCFLLFPLTLAYSNWEKVDLSSYQIGGVFSRDMLRAANPPGIIVPGGDTPSFNLQVGYFIEGIASGSVVINPGRFGMPSYRHILMIRYPHLIFPENFGSTEKLDSTQIATQFLMVNIEKYPVYFYDSFVASEGYKLIQQGMLLRLYKNSQVPDEPRLEKIILARVADIELNAERERSKYTHFFADQIMLEYADRLNKNGRELLAIGKFASAREVFMKALDSDPQHKGALFGIGISYFEEGECQKSKESFESLVSQDSDYWQAYEGLARTYEKCWDDKNKRDEYLQRAKEIREKGTLEPIS